MKHAYRCARPLLAALLLFTALSARAQQAWRPFRPGLIYAYAASPITSSSALHTLRVDSAYVAANGDSVYAFNHMLRPTVTLSYQYSKSKNNLFGALLRWRAGQLGYTLEAVAQSNVQAAVSWRLLPQAAVGSSWVTGTPASSTATLVSRSWQTISAGVQDTVAVISINTGSSTQTVRLSRRYGLLAGPQWLGGATGVQMEMALLPTRYEQSLYSPLQLFDVQPGDEFGYREDDIGITPTQCYSYFRLRRVTGRQLTADSLIITYREQTRYENGGGPFCGPLQVTFSPVGTSRWAMGRAGNSWKPTNWVTQLGLLSLLTWEYAPVVGTSGSTLFEMAGLPIGPEFTSTCLANLPGRSVSYAPFFRQGVATYGRGLDYLDWGYSFAQGLARTREQQFGLIYTRKTVNGVTLSCGNPNQLGFGNLLPTRAAQAATIATLHPNPATDAATLTLAQPARPGHTLHLTDTLGRTVWSAPVPTGQTTVAVPLAGQPAGLYLLHLEGSETAASWKLMHE